MTHPFFHLARDKKLTEELQRQLDALSNHNDDSLAELEFLDAIIHEALRLHPAVPSGVQRLTSAEGLTVGETYIPGHTLVQVPLHTVFRGKYPNFNSNGPLTNKS